MNNSISIFALVTLSLLLSFSCKQSTSPSEIVLAPSRTLPASEIMRLQGLTSIHYVDYDSSIVNGQPDSGFHAFFEYYIDSARLKLMQYYLDNLSWNVTVYDLAKDTVWNFYSGKVTYPTLPDIRLAFQGSVQAYLGSWLTEPARFVRQEWLADKLCNVFIDSTGYEEWVWVEHRLPIQRRTEGVYDVHQISYVQKRNIQINLQFSNSIFQPPS